MRRERSLKRLRDANMDREHQTERDDDMSAWREDRKLVLHVIGENTAAIRELSSKIEAREESASAHRHKQDRRISRIEQRSGVFGTIGGILGVILVFGFEWVRSLINKS